MIYRSSILAVAIASASSTLLAYDSDPLEISVTGTRSYSSIRTAQSSQVITAEEIATAGISTLGEAIEQFSGVTLARNGSVGSSSAMFVRGSNSNHVVVLLDGQRLTSTTDGKTEIEYIPIELVERIEFVAGGLSTLYGSDAIGGVLQIFTKPLASQPIQTVALGLGDGHSKTTYTHTGRLGGTASYRINAGQEYTTGYDASNVYTDSDSDGYSKRFIDLAVSKRSGQLALSGFLGEWDGTTEFDEDTFSNKNATDFSTRRVGAKLSYLAGDLGFESQITDLTNDRKNYDLADKSDSETTEVDRLEWTNTLNKEFSSDLALTAGFDARNESAISTYANGKSQTRGVFASISKKFDQLQAETGVRRERHSDYGYQTSWSTGVTLPLNHHSDLFASRKFAYANPTLADLDPTWGNPALLPESAYSTEVGYRFGDLGGWSGHLIAYETKFTNLIEFENWALSNIGNARTRGVELNIKQRFESVELDAKLAYLDGENLDQGGAPLINRAEQRAVIRSSYHLSEATSVNVGYQFTGNMTSLDAVDYSAKDMPDYSLWRIGGLHRYNDNLSLSLFVDNALDKSYEPVDGFNGRGRYVEARINYTF